MTSTSREAITGVIDTLATRYLNGKVRSVTHAMIALLSEGHLLLEDIPGLGKTTLALALAGAFDLSFGRVQCTSDLLPSDITGLSIFNRDESRFTFVAGPIFNNLVLVDELNRAMPKTQSALLEAMEERRVTVEGVTYELPDPFMVIATQNPLEQVGTFPLPESQLDRFLIRAGIGYPAKEVEKEIIRGGSIRKKIRDMEPLLEADVVLAARGEIRESVFLSEKIVDYVYDLVERTRKHPLLSSGISTRGALSMAEAAKAAAWLAGRDFVAPEDVKAVAVRVGAHRLMLRPGHEHLNKEDVLRNILAETAVPLV